MEPSADEFFRKWLEQHVAELQHANRLKWIELVLQIHRMETRPSMVDVIMKWFARHYIEPLMEEEKKAMEKQRENGEGGGRVIFPGGEG